MINYMKGVRSQHLTFTSSDLLIVALTEVYYFFDKGEIIAHQNDYQLTVKGSSLRLALVSSRQIGTVLPDQEERVRIRKEKNKNAMKT